MKNNQTKAFTLIELLVVIAIIGMLSSIVLVSVNSSREKAKIAKAQDMVNSLYKIILMNYQESNGTSPSPSNTDIGTGCSYWSPGTIVGFVNNTGDYYANWLGPWVGDVPKDPWGNCYSIDGPINESCPGDPCGSKICSAGTNGVFESWNGCSPINRGDDICKAFNCP
ncbi:prepilin-type N-terminal cleavage/methylation domain-containing protein [Patescibacteria group bacterium]|nr:prepilin-type N-terminal cleavage/methylation domain-containing protein [Patescibacteria group bacterium]MBU1876842.1 prepilin-type N-terminal cleavage/methylation domain-containing protein [Patescibacteria group bacterium]